MQAMSVRDYRSNLSAAFDRADKGDEVLIRRRNELYALVKVGREEVSISPDLQKRLDEARQSFRRGEGKTFHTWEDTKRFLDSL